MNAFDDLVYTCVCNVCMHMLFSMCICWNAGGDEKAGLRHEEGVGAGGAGVREEQ